MIRPLLILIAMNVAWAGTYAVVKYGLGTMTPFSLVFWRMSVAALILWVWVIFKGINWRINRGDILRIVGLGIVMASSHILWVSGLKFTNASDAAILYAFEPIWSIVLVSLILKERFHFGMGIGLALALVGLIILSQLSFTTMESLFLPTVALGNFLVVAGLFMESLYSILAKPIATRYSSAVVVACALSVTSVLLLIPMTILEGFTYPKSVGEIGAILYLSVPCTVIGYALWIKVMRRLPVNVMLYTIFVQPVVGPFIAYLALHEEITRRVFEGGLFIVAGVAAAIYSYLKAHRSLTPSIVTSPVAAYDQE